MFTLFIIKYYEPVSINGSLFVQLYSFTIIATMAAAEEILLRGILYRINWISIVFISSLTAKDSKNVALTIDDLPALSLGKIEPADGWKESDAQSGHFP